MGKGMTDVQLRVFAVQVILTAYLRAEDGNDFLSSFFGVIRDVQYDELGEDWKTIGRNDFLAILSGHKSAYDCAFAYGVFVNILANHMIDYGVDDTDINGDGGPVWISLKEVGKVSSDFKQKYALLEQAVIRDARAIVEALDDGDND